MVVACSRHVSLNQDAFICHQSLRADLVRSRVQPHLAGVDIFSIEHGQDDDFERHRGISFT